MTDVIINSGSVPVYASLSAFPTSATDGALAVDASADSLYEFDAGTNSWVLIGPGGGGGGGITALTGGVTASGSGSVVATVVTNANLTGPVTSVGNATAIANLAITNAMIDNSTIDLTTKVTGILPTANGGTGVSSAYTAGSVIFSNGTVLAQDNANFFWDDTNKVFKLKNDTIEVGSVDPFGRTQIWNHASNASLRLGSLGQDGDPTDSNSEGSVFYGPNSQGTAINSATGNFGYARVKADRVGLYTSINNTAFYYFRADPTSLFLANDSNVTTFQVTRATGTINSASLTASTALVSDASKNIVSSSVTATELGYVSGVTSSIQTQLNAVVPASRGGAAPVTNTFYVDGSRVDSYTADGSFTKPYLTIQAAITKAATVATSTIPAIVSIMPGNYVENLTLASYVYVSGTAEVYQYQDVTIQGTITANLSTASARAGISNVTVTSGTSNCLTISGSTYFKLYVQNVNFSTTSATIISINNTGTSGGLKTTLTTVDCTMSVATSGGVVTTSNGAMVDYRSTFTAPSLSGRTIVFSGGTGTFYSSIFTGYVESNTSGAITLIGAQISSGSSQAIIANSNVTIRNCLLTSTASNVVTGSGSFTASVTAYGSGSSLASTLNSGSGGRSLLSPTDASILFTPAVSGNWTSVPTTVRSALDTLAAKSVVPDYAVNTFTLTGTNITNKSVTLSFAPVNPTLTVLSVVGGPVQDYSSDFMVSGSTLSWNGLFLDGVLVSGDKLIVQFY